MTTIRLTPTERARMIGDDRTARRYRQALEHAVERLVRAETAYNRTDSDRNEQRVNDELAWLEDVAGRFGRYIATGRRG